MTAKPSWLFQQSAVVPIFGDKVVLITRRRSDKWTIPKGVIEKDLDAAQSALKEAQEEAGITGQICLELGVYRYEKWGGTCTVRAYMMRVHQLLDDWPERQVRQRRLVSVEECLDLLENIDLRRMIAQVAMHI